jgi:hypothetical protein
MQISETRACPGDAGCGVPVLPWRDQPQYQDALLPLGHVRRRVGCHRARVPASAWTLSKGGRPAEHCRRDIIDGIRY